MGASAPARATRPAFANSSRRFFLDMPASYFPSQKNQASHLPLRNTARFLHIDELTVAVRETLSRARLCVCPYVDRCYEFGDRLPASGRQSRRSFSQIDNR